MSEMLEAAFQQFSARIAALESQGESYLQDPYNQRALNLLGNWIYDCWELIFCEHHSAAQRTTQGIQELQARWARTH